MADPLKFLPAATWGTIEKSVASRETLNSSATSAAARQLTVAAESAPIRVTYGRDRIGAQIANVLLHGSFWVFQAIWGEGECDAIEAVTLNDAALPAGTQSIHYAGTISQTADPWLAAAFAAKGQTYSDALPGVCYSVLRVPVAAIDGFPQISALLRGRKVEALFPFGLSDRITVSSSDKKTYWGADGLLKTAAANTWPLEYDPETLEPVGRSVWESRTNRLTYSEQFDNAGWVKNNSSISANAATAPDGTATADKLVENTATTNHSVTQTHLWASGTTYTGSIFAKAAGRTRIQIAFPGAEFPNAYANFDLSAGTVTASNSTTASITHVGGGWYRCVATATATGSAATGFAFVLITSGTAGRFQSYTGDGASGVYIWGAQLEVGAFATPYIKTVAATVTRAADLVTISGGNFSDWYSPTGGTFLAEASRGASTTNPSVFAAGDGSASNIVSGYLNGPAGKWGGLVVAGGVSQADLYNDAGFAVTPGTPSRIAVAYAADDFAAAVNSALLTDTTGTVPTVNALYIGQSTSGGSPLNGHIRSITYWSSRLADADLQTLTGPGQTYLDARVQPSLILDFTADRYLVKQTRHTANPSLALADFLTNTTYGARRPVDWASVVVTMEADDELVGGQPRRTINLTLDTVQEVDRWADTLRTYAGCWLHGGTNGVRLIPDRPAASVASYDHANGDIMALGGLRLRPVSDAPTVMTISCTDTSVTPWRDAKVTVYAPGVEEGLTPRRASDVALPGIQSKAQAYREAVERLNKLTLSDLSFEITVRDLGVRHEVGDVVDVTHPVGLTAKLMRVVGIAGEAGRYRLQLTEYDPAAYSDAVVSEPSTPDTSLPDPGTPLPVTGLTLVEEVFQQQDGTYSSRIRATWSAPDFPWVSFYRVDVLAGGAVVQSGQAAAGAVTWPTGAVQEGVLHQVEVVTVSSTGASSPAAYATLTPAGKQLPPGNVPGITGFEVGGEVRLAWTPAVDLDIWRYEVRYVTAGGTWANGTLIDRTDALRLLTKDVPVGTWDFMVKALDSVGQYSAAEARREITVTLDAAAFLADSATFDTPTISNMTEYALYRGDPLRRFVTDDGVAWNTKFSAAMNTYTDPLLSYSTAASSFTTESEDFGLVLAGNWRGELSVTNLAGTADQIIDLGPDGSTWTAYPGLTAKASARWARLRAVGTSGEVMIVTLPTATVRIDAVPRTESGESTSLASGGKTITLAGSYAAVKTLTATPLGTSARTYTIDNIIVGTTTSFDVYVFDVSGTQVAGGFQWSFNGV